MSGENKAVSNFIFLPPYEVPMDELCSLWKTPFYVEEGCRSEEEAEIMKSFAFYLIFFGSISKIAITVLVSATAVHNSLLSVCRHFGSYLTPCHYCTNAVQDFSIDKTNWKIAEKTDVLLKAANCEES
ncbi:hypothetical protein Peur_031067 [Populus x canadensis]